MNKVDMISLGWDYEERTRWLKRTYPVCQKSKDPEVRQAIKNIEERNKILERNKKK